MSDDYSATRVVVGVLLAVLAAVGMMPLGATPAHATLIGDTVTVQEYYPTLSAGQ